MMAITSITLYKVPAAQTEGVTLGPYLQRLTPCWVDVYMQVLQVSEAQPGLPVHLGDRGTRALAAEM